MYLSPSLCCEIKSSVADQSTSAWLSCPNNVFAVAISSALGPVNTACMVEYSPPDTVDWKLDNKLEYELTIEPDPDKFVKSF